MVVRRGGRGTAVALAAAPMVPGSRLPGEASVRRDLVDGAVRDINRLYVTKGLETARLIGQYVLGTFFGGSVESFQKRGRKHVSFRELARRGDLRVSHSFLWSAVRFVDQARLLPRDVAESLPLSHHTALLPVRDARQKVILARKAVRDGLSHRKLVVEVRKVTAKRVGRRGVGRPALPVLVRACRLLRRVVELADGQGKPGAPGIEQVPRQELREMVAEAERHLRTLDGVVERLKDQLRDEQPGAGHGSL